MSTRKLTFQEQLIKFRDVHGNKYQYDESTYMNTTTKMRIICPIHGEFWQRPTDHKEGNDCPKCSNKKRIIPFNIMLKRFKNTHKDKYEYFSETYRDGNHEMKIKCNKCGTIFWQLPRNHLLGHGGCPNCNKKRLSKRIKMSYKDQLKEFKKIHDDKYTYIKSSYVDNKTKMKIICPEHGEFKQSPDCHKRGQGCPKCGKIKRAENSIIPFKKRIIQFNKTHNNKYTYDESTYTNVYTKMKIICPEHGEFYQEPASHIKGVGCPKCKQSRGEREISQFLSNNNIKFITQYKFEDCKHNDLLSFDFYLPEYNICIEYDGIQHYEFCDYFYKDVETFNDRQLKDKIKDNYCFVKKIKLVRIPYYEYNKITVILHNIILL